MTDPKADPLDDPAMAGMLRRYGAQAAHAPGTMSPQRRTALDAQLDAVDAALDRRRAWGQWLWSAAVAAVLIVSVALALRSAVTALPVATAQVARARAQRGAPDSPAFVVHVQPRASGFVRIYAFTADGRRRPLALRDDQLIEPIAARTTFGEFELPDAWRVLVAVARARTTLDLPDLVPAQLAGATPAERERALAEVALALRGQGITAIGLRLP